MARKAPSIIIAYWDTGDSNNIGWSWRAHWYDADGEHQHEKSGGFAGRNNLSDATIARRAKAEAGYPRHRMPVEIHR